MSYQYWLEDTEKRTHPKTHFQKYLRNINEPRDDVGSDMPAALEAELLENSYVMRGQVRRMARRIRNR